MEQAEILKTSEDIAESLLSAIETARQRLLRKIKRKRRKLVKFVQGVGEDFDALTKKWTKSFVTVSLAVGIFITTAAPITAASVPKIEARATVLQPAEKDDLRQKILDYLQRLGRKRRINAQLLANLVSQITALPLRTTLDSNKLPTVYGEIATEKHLMVYSGQKLSEHLSTSNDFQRYSWTGISNSAPAWGYFAQSPEFVTDDLVKKEKYYLVIQTFAAEHWSRDWPSLKEWYKFRKLLVYNPKNGKAVVGVIGDAGPAKFTGRVFGGSPEVMEGLGLSETTTTGEVLVFFLDDPNDSFSLGPVFNQQTFASFSENQ